MTVWTRIATIDRTREARSIKIKSAIGQRSTASFTVYDEDGSLNFSKGQQVDIVRNGFPPFVKVLFSGVISKPTEKRVPANDMVYHHLQCMDWHYLADKRLAAMSWVATEYQNYTAGDDGAVAVHGLNWYGQTFTPSTTHTVTRIRLLLYRVGNPGTVTISIKATDAGDDPTGADLIVGTINGNALTTAAAGEWTEIDMTTQVEFTAATIYGIVVRAPDGDAANYAGWRKNSGGAYAAGEYEASADGGTTWTPDNAQDFMFEEWYYPFAGFIVEDLFDAYLDPEGVTNGNIDQGPAIKEMLVNYQPVSKALDALAVRAGYEWEIDYFKRLYFQSRTTTTAPFAVTENLLKRSTSLAYDSSEYRNRQFIRAGIDITALQTETYTGDGVTKSFPMGYRINQEPAVTVAGAPVSIGLKGIDDVNVCYWSPGDPIIVFTAAPGAVAIVVTYYGEYDIMVQVEDAVEIAARAAAEGNTGINENISDEPYLTDKDDAINSALAALDYYGVIGKQFNFAITTWGLEPGQIVTVTDAAYSLTAEDLLITAVSVTEIAPETLRFAITAITGPNMGDWTAFFGRLAAFKDDLAGRLAVGEDSILIIMDYETAIWEQVGVVTTTPVACFLCDPLTICEPATIVC